jgi:hypothetical protein
MQKERGEGASAIRQAVFGFENESNIVGKGKPGIFLRIEI